MNGNLKYKCLKYFVWKMTFIFVAEKNKCESAYCVSLAAVF